MTFSEVLTGGIREKSEKREHSTESQEIVGEFHMQELAIALFSILWVLGHAVFYLLNGLIHLLLDTFLKAWQILVPTLALGFLWVWAGLNKGKDD